jgi:predicted alpha-1,2-mannosidase
MRSRNIASYSWVAAAGVLAAGASPARVEDPSARVNPFIGTANGGNTFPGAVLPFGMLQWSPETSRGDATRAAAPGGYAYDARRIRGFSLTHLSGTGCRGASGDIPFMPHVGAVTSSPALDKTDRVYTSPFAHTNETASPGYYQVRLESGVNVELTATARTGSGRFTFPAGSPATMLVRTSDSELGSTEAEVQVDAEARTVRGSVSSGNFCGYLDEINRRSYYTLHFVAVFDRPFASVGAWEDATVTAGETRAKGGKPWGDDGFPQPGRGSGAYVVFDGASGAAVNVRVGISYVSAANAAANLRAENPEGTTFDAVRARAREAWNTQLRRIEVDEGTPAQLTLFYTALYHSLLHPNLFSDVNGEYWGFDQKPHRLSGKQKAQYANFSGWDAYRSQVHLVAFLEPAIGSDIAQSLLNQADQYGGVWDRWTHNSGATSVMSGDPSAPTVAGMYAFGARDFEVERAFASLAKAARVPTSKDLSDYGCIVSCAGQRPSLDKWLKVGFIPRVSNSWGGAGETLEDVTADFSLAQLALRVGDKKAHDEFLARSAYWRNIFNTKATPDGGYIQNRDDDGTWPPFDPADDAGFAEGSSAQYTWMIPFDPRGLFEAMGGTDKANARLDAFFRHADGAWALTGSGGLKSEMDNEPSVGAPWLYLYSGRPARTQETIRQVLKTLWSDSPYGIPGNDDLGAMSSWYVWAAMGMYPGIPGRAELLLTSPLHPQIVIHTGGGKSITIRAPKAAELPYVRGLRVNGKSSTKAWLPESFVAEGGTLDYELSATADPTWATAPADAPPSFSPERR